MKILCYGDTHAHLFPEFADLDPDYGNTRFREIIKTFEVMRRYCLDNEINCVLDSGDLFHKRVSVNTLVYNKVFEEIKKFSDAKIKMIMIPGNHTQVDNSDFPEHSLEPFKEIKNVEVLDKFEPYHFQEGVTIYPAPYSKNAEMVKEYLNDYAKHAESLPEESHILLAHLGVTGATIGKSSYPMADAFGVGDLYPEIFDFVVLGHFHKPQNLPGCESAFYTGAPIQHNFNDEGEDRGFVVIDTDSGKMKRVPIDSPKFITVTDADNFDQEELEGNYVRFQIPAENIERLEEKLPSDLKRRIEPQKEYKNEQRVNIDFSMSMYEVVSKYCQEFRPEAEEVMLDILREVE